MTKPLFPANPERLEKIAEQLLSEKPRTDTAYIPGRDVKNPQDYIILEGKTHGSYSYPDLLVSKYRLGFDDEVQEAARRAELAATNTAKENNGRDYIGNINWEQALKLNEALDNFTLNLRQYADFLALLKSGKIYEGRGKKLDNKEAEAILDEILTVRSSWRAEWLDAHFNQKGKVLVINYNHRTIDGEFKPQNSEPLTECLMEDKKPGIDLADWIANATYQGLPPKNAKEGELYYWHPRKGYVARFGAGSGWADLNCDGRPGDSDSALGVRRARIYKTKTS